MVATVEVTSKLGESPDFEASSVPAPPTREWVARGRHNKTKGIKIGNELHLALERGAWSQCIALIEGSPALLVGKNKSGCTPLMLAAMGKCPDGVIDVMLLHGAGATASTKKMHKTAADFAEIHGKQDLAVRLRALEVFEPSRTCDCCGERFDPHNKVSLLAERVARGEETNPLLTKFSSSDWAGVQQAMKNVAFHTLTSSTFHFSKELTETLGVLDLIEHLLHTKVHLIDFLCGKSLTTVIASLKYGCHVTAVDRLDSNQLPHYDKTDLPVTYLQLDVWDPHFVDNLIARVNEVGLPTVLVSIHCCGLLGVLATELFHRADLIKDVVLVPCCFPPQSDPRTPTEIFDTPEEVERRQRWISFLQKTIGAKAVLTSMDNVISVQRTAILCAK